MTQAEDILASKIESLQKESVGLVADNSRLRVLIKKLEARVEFLLDELMESRTR